METESLKGSSVCSLGACFEVRLDQKKPPPPGGVSYLLCSLIKNPVSEDPPRRICTRFCTMVVSVLMDCLIEEPMDWFQSALTCGFWNRRHGSVCCRARIGIGVGSRMQWHEEGCHGKKFWSPHAARHVRATHVRATSAAEW